MARIPLRARNGAVRAHAIVDDADLAMLSNYRWYFNGQYAARGDGSGRPVYMHRQLLGLERGDPHQADHINQDKLDNRRANLRVVNKAGNSQNLGVREQRGKTSRYRGVSWDATYGKWVASATLEGRFHNLGRFDHEDDANVAAAAFRAKRMPFSSDARKAVA